MAGGQTTLRVLVSDYVLRGRGLPDLNFAPPVGYPVPVVKVSTLSGYPSLRNVINALSVDTVIDLEGLAFQDRDFAMGANTYVYYGSHAIGFVNGSMTEVPNSSTHVTAINTQVANNTGTIQEALLRVGRGTSAATTPFLADLRFPASIQGHIYNGVILYYCTDGIIQDTTITGILGTSGAPPGETFALNNYHSTGTIIRRVVVDGAGQMSAGLGNNYCDNTLVQDSTFKGSGYGAGITHYLSSNSTFERCTFDANHLYGINCEKVSGTVTVRSCIWRNTGVAHMCVDTDGPSAIVNIYDPIYDGTKFKIKRHNTYNYPPPATSPNQQNISGLPYFPKWCRRYGH
jgi:hypothetical protein